MSSCMTLHKYKRESSSLSSYTTAKGEIHSIEMRQWWWWWRETMYRFYMSKVLLNFGDMIVQFTQFSIIFWTWNIKCRTPNTKHWTPECILHTKTLNWKFEKEENRKWRDFVANLPVSIQIKCNSVSIQLNCNESTWIPNIVFCVINTNSYT